MKVTINVLPRTLARIENRGKELGFRKVERTIESLLQVAVYEYVDRPKPRGEAEVGLCGRP